MKPCLHRARAAAVLAMCSATVAAQAQTYTLMSPPLQWARQYFCTVTNVSNQPVTVQKVEIVQGGTVYWDGSSACTGTLAAGTQCVHRTAASVTEPRQPYCRVQYSGAEGSLLASFLGNFEQHVNTSEPYGAASVVALRAVKTIPLSPAN